VVNSGLCELLTLGDEVDGQRNAKALDFVGKSARHKSKDVPPLLQRSVELAWTDL